MFWSAPFQNARVPLALIAFFYLPLVALAQQPDKVIKITRITQPPKIDGSLDDPCWQGIIPVSGFYQYDPNNGQSASEETFVQAAYDDKNIYFAFLMKDSQPDRIYAELTPRNGYYGNDTITVSLDTYNDKRTSMVFGLNPKGVQYNSVETIWSGNARKTKEGWAAEMAIPFKSLRFSKDEHQVWGVNFGRYIARLKEADYWTKVGRDEPFLQKSGTIIGLEMIKPGHNLEIFPYVGFRYSNWDQDSSDNGREDEKKLAAGLDFKYGLASNLVLDMTVSPDFSEVESDPFIYQLSPYEVQFQEHRPFFTEGSQYFETPRFTFFYSRRISDPRFAAKLTGKSHGYSFGILGTINNEHTEDNSKYIVVRVNKDVLANSQIGFYYTGFDQGSDWDRAFSTDWSFRWKNIYFCSGQLGMTLNNSGGDDHNKLCYFHFERSPDVGVSGSVSYERVEPEVDVRSGFISMKDYQSLKCFGGYSWRFQNSLAKTLNFTFYELANWDCTGEHVCQDLSVFAGIQFKNRSYLSAGFGGGKSRYQIYRSDDLVWDERFFPGHYYSASYYFYYGRLFKGYRLSYYHSHQALYINNYTDLAEGNHQELDGQLTLRPRDNVEVAAEAGYTKEKTSRDQQTIFSGATYGLSLQYQMTKNWCFYTRFNGETRLRQYNLDMVWSYNFGAGNLFQVSYKKSHQQTGLSPQNGYSLTAKFSYLLRM